MENLIYGLIGFNVLLIVFTGIVVSFQNSAIESTKKEIQNSSIMIRTLATKASELKQKYRKEQ